MKREFVVCGNVNGMSCWVCAQFWPIKTLFSLSFFFFYWIGSPFFFDLRSKESKVRPYLFSFQTWLCPTAWRAARVHSTAWRIGSPTASALAVATIMPSSTQTSNPPCPGWCFCDTKTGCNNKVSTLFFRYWTMDRSLQRRLQKTNYQHIKRLCRDRGQLFEDADFPPMARSLYKNKKPSMYPITWLRPHVSCWRCTEHKSHPVRHGTDIRCGWRQGDEECASHFATLCNAFRNLPSHALNNGQCLKDSTFLANFAKCK